MNINTVKYVLKDPGAIIPMLGSKGLLNWIPDKIYLQFISKTTQGCWLNMKDPRTLNEKLQWMKIYDRDPLHTKLVDKYEVREYISKAVGEQYLNELVGGPWESVEEIDFGLLPDDCVLKATHDSGGIIIYRNKDSFDVAQAKAKLRKRLSRDFYRVSREWPYKNVKPRVVAEKLLKNSDGTPIVDYKFYCYGGEPRYFMVSFGEAEHNVKNHKFDMECNSIDWLFKEKETVSADNIKLPENIDEMILVVRKLCADFQHVRVDLYNVDGKIYFGEMTFFSNGGFLNIQSNTYSNSLANYIDIGKCAQGRK